jgi:tetratricopeptide (TPR) repeat protein
MTKTCPSCGFVSNAEARFCRMCGAMLPRPNEVGDDAVSPIAATVPLSGTHSTTTGELSPHDTGSPNRARTAHIRSGEMEEFLRRSRDPDAPALASDAATHPAPDADTHAHTTPDGEPQLTIRVRPIESDTHAPDAPPTGTHDANDDAPTSAAPPVTLSSAALSSTALPSATLSNTTTPAETANAQPPTPHDTAPHTPTNRANSGASRATEDRALRLWAGAAVFCVVALVVAAGVVLAWYAAHKLRRPAAANVASSAPVAPATDEARRAADAKIKEADELLAAGRAGEAVARLREAAAADPTNAEPHRRLARLLIEEGARRTAIEELQSVVRLDANDAAAWRDLASAQSAEGLYAAAAESYHKLFGLSSEATADDRLQLAYADALRQSGRASEAHALYKRLAASRVAEVAHVSRQQLTNANADDAKNANANANTAHVVDTLPADSPNVATHDARAIETARATDANGSSVVESRPSPPALPASASPKDHFERGVILWRANRAAALAEFGAAAQGGNSDASYYLGLNLAEGRDPRALKHAELVAALTYFQRARRSRFSAEARRYEDTLAREYDRRINEQR